MGSVFPEVFDKEVPCPVVALAATAVYTFFCICSSADLQEIRLKLRWMKCWPKAKMLRSNVTFIQMFISIFSALCQNVTPPTFIASRPDCFVRNGQRSGGEWCLGSAALAHGVSLRNGAPAGTTTGFDVDLD